MLRSAFTTLMARSLLSDDGWIGSWSPGIGDPTFVGWVTVVAYFVAAFLCWRNYRRLPGARPGGFEGFLTAVLPLGLALFVSKRRLLSLPQRQRVASLWLGLAIVLTLLGINKQLDLQSAFTEVGRMMAYDEGWYGVRRKIQAVFILAVVLTGLWVFRALVHLASGSVGRLRPVLAGTIFIIAFVAIRAASFHHVDLMLGLSLGAFKLNWIIELGGIAFVAIGAYREGRGPAPPVKRPVRPR